jgi:hypothetical protein
MIKEGEKKAAANRKRSYPKQKAGGEHIERGAGACAGEIRKTLERMQDQIADVAVDIAAGY